MSIRKISFLRVQRLEQESLTLGVALLMAVALALLSPAFLDANNLASLQTSIAPNLIVALGMMTLFMIGRFDLSVGAVMGISGIAAAMALDAGAPMPLGIAAGLAAGLAIGAFNGFMVAYLGINHLIVTLGVLYMTRGIIEVIMVGAKLAGFTSFPASFSALGQWSFGGISAIFVFALLLCLCAELFLRLTFPGRSLLFLGGNPQAAEATGLNRRRIEFWAFVLSGGLAALAGVLMTARIGMANRYMGEGLEMQIFIACLVGGGSIGGGKGSYVGALVGVLFIALLTNAFNLLAVPSEWQAVVIGGVLVLVVTVDAILVLRKAGRPWRAILGLRPAHLRG
ncbi:ABC transporter permease [Cereibacter changlensis]|jgi:ribose/xylose/arabinose/galactoside ABC-type transport system permease subunit|uniref:ABC transporter permease n=1 Tax=Cereibacter changlensis TaxID=402884 RepID=A0A4U0YXB0_9RHOB|nr:ABC transporter permease [Cereibacter changlensis]MBZ4689171.1 transporter permease [Cereibacter sp.]TKA97450.1 ABC transporter permease [Cereibacter changlensis]